MTLSHLEYEYSQRLLEGAKKSMSRKLEMISLSFHLKNRNPMNMIDGHQRRRLKEND